ncbi:transcription initiation factor TFIID subunit 4-like [Notechis scutatus]|uniref:Transcription initiation factor TFIID subunit 4-like n=1 Tax=Notechis scutatus TaxID=8663 RepID=A0A6J1VWC4_9SAUR|nr:transcription initiation factor TFIID subunit 4-like [Notechis scutatus]
MARLPGGEERSGLGACRPTDPTRLPPGSCQQPSRLNHPDNRERRPRRRKRQPGSGPDPSRPPGSLLPSPVKTQAGRRRRLPGGGSWLAGGRRGGPGRLLTAASLDPPPPKRPFPRAPRASPPPRLARGAAEVPSPPRLRLPIQRRAGLPRSRARGPSGRRSPGADPGDSPAAKGELLPRTRQATCLSAAAPPRPARPTGEAELGSAAAPLSARPERLRGRPAGPKPPLMPGGPPGTPAMPPGRLSSGGGAQEAEEAPFRPPKAAPPGPGLLRRGSRGAEEAAAAAAPREEAPSLQLGEAARGGAAAPGTEQRLPPACPAHLAARAGAPPRPRASPPRGARPAGGCPRGLRGPPGASPRAPRDGARRPPGGVAGVTRHPSPTAVAELRRCPEWAEKGPVGVSSKPARPPPGCL